MKKVILTIVLIIVAVGFYFGFKALTYEPKEEPERNVKIENNENVEKEAVIAESDSTVYKEFYEAFLEAANKNIILLQSEDDFMISYTYDSFSALSTFESGDYQFGIGYHASTFDENREPLEENIFDLYFEKIEDYDLGDIEGIIAKDLVFDHYTFLSTKEVDGVLLDLSIKNVEDIDEIKEALEQVELNRELPKMTTERIAELTDIHLDDVLAFNLDDESINLINMELQKNPNNTQFSITYDLDGERSFDVLLNISQLNEEEELDILGKAIELDNGRTVYRNDSLSSNYTLQEGSYLYRIVFLKTEMTEEEELDILNKLNVKMLD